MDKIAIFNDFDAQERRRIEKCCIWRNYAANETIAAASEHASDVFVLTAGRARAFIASPTGVVVAFGDIGAGTMFGEIAAIDGEPRPVDVEAVTACTVGRLPNAVFMDLINNRPGFARAVLVQVATNIRRLTARVFEFSTLPVKNRVHAELLRLISQVPHRKLSANRIIISPAPKHAAMAAKISTHREAVTRELNYLVKSGVLKKSGSDLEICDVAKLRQMVEDALHRGGT